MYAFRYIVVGLEPRESENDLRISSNRCIIVKIWIKLPTFMRNHKWNIQISAFSIDLNWDPNIKFERDFTFRVNVDCIDVCGVANFCHAHDICILFVYCKYSMGLKWRRRNKIKRVMASLTICGPKQMHWYHNGNELVWLLVVICLLV